MSDTPKGLAQKLEKEGRKNLAFFESLKLDDWEQPSYSEGAQWTVRQVFTHIVEVEQSIPDLVLRIIGGEPGVPEDFDIDRWNKSKVEKMGHIPVDQLLVNFAHRRKWTVEMVAGLEEADLKKIGNHPFLGETEVADMLRLMYLHIQLHIRDIRKALSEKE